MEGSSSLHGLAGACAVWTPLLEHHGAHMIGEVLLSTASVQLFSVCLYLLDMEGFNSHGGLMEMEQLKLVADPQKGLADLVVLLPVIL